MNNINIVIPMAGNGSRFQNTGITTPKPLIIVDGKTLIEHSIESLGIPGRYIFITREYDDISHNEKLTQIFKTLAPDHIEIRVSGEQRGAADSALVAKDYIDNDDRLVIANCDQLLNWDADDFIAHMNDETIDGSVILFKSNSIKNSFAVIENKIITRLAEKNPISNNALIGVHYWKSGSDFVSSAKKLLNDYRAIGLPEAYVAPTYNYLIEDGKKIYPFFIDNEKFICLGTPEDVGIYLLKQENK